VATSLLNYPLDPLSRSFFSNFDRSSSMMNKDACQVLLLGLLQEKAIAIVKLGDQVKGLLLAPSNTGPKPGAV
jgi:hypothetical protein